MKDRKLSLGIAEISLMRFWRMSKTSKVKFTLSIVAGLVAGGSQAYLLALINLALAEGQLQNASGVAWEFFGLCVLVFSSGTLSLILLSQIAQDNLYNLRLWLSHRILAAPFAELHSCGSHRLMAVLTDDVGNIVHAQNSIPVLFVEGSKLVAAFVYLGLLSSSLLFLVLAFVVCGLISWRFLQKWAWKWLLLEREADDALFGHYKAVTEGSKELKMDARRRRAFLDEELSGAADTVRRRANGALTFFAVAERWSQSLYFFLIGVIVFLPSFVPEIHRESSTGFTLAILFIGAPLTAIVDAVPTIGKGIAAYTNIRQLGLASAADADVVADLETRTTVPSALELVDVGYHYKEDGREDGYRLGPLSLSVAPGELIFLTGGNGSGKTTLALIMLGLLSPDLGEVRLGGQRITDANREAYRQNFSAVFADAYVFESLLGYSTPDLLARADELLALLHLDDKVSIENGRFSTVELSRGQRKRLALLAACLADRPFYLFDEWAAEQDPIFRSFFYSAMLPDLKARGKTVIVISHDDHYFHLCDRLVRLNEGRIEERGARDRAIAGEGSYA
jgi:putative ATP-binding cassette transporter